MKTKKQYLITVVVEATYSKVIKATSLKAAEARAYKMSIQDDEDCYDGTETMEAIVEKIDKEGFVI